MFLSIIFPNWILLSFSCKACLTTQFVGRALKSNNNTINKRHKELFIKSERSVGADVVSKAAIITSSTWIVRSFANNIFLRFILIKKKNREICKMQSFTQFVCMCVSKVEWVLSYKRKSMQFSKSIFIFIFHIDTCTRTSVCLYMSTSPCAPVVVCQPKGFRKRKWKT